MQNQTQQKKPENGKRNCDQLIHTDILLRYSHFSQCDRNQLSCVIEKKMFIVQFHCICTTVQNFEEKKHPSLGKTI